MPAEIQLLLVTGFRFLLPGDIFADSDGPLRPAALVTKGEMAQMLYNLLEVQNSAPKHGYSDVKGSWADTAVGTLCALGILPDGTGVFGLDQPATRAEFVKALAVILEIQPDSAAEGFTDTDGHALAGTFAAFRKRGILKGYPDGTARPEGTLSRAEMVTMINRGIARAASAEPTGFRDVPRDHWASGEIRAAAGK